ncbi:hypothetical protein JAAARDRAFT_39316 [Jaapia argillacea MUCL 33604]|uniref:Uncharacterized protein n=1 Tax=Jaapia argillacea MUCL 33604 TaxID=933084 RepID=A0A067PFS5_9AGAM|nr:hypothetical protein JAAARDRAFT_39316 [Jaapia argillacea MUCL 33604]
MQSEPTPTLDSIDSKIFSDCEPVYHPLFSSPQADIVLGSKSNSVIEPIVYAAEKYDMPGPLSIVCALSMAPHFLSDPLRLYSMACRYTWSEEARSASTLSLSLPISTPPNTSPLSTPSPHGLPLGDGIVNAGSVTWREAKACWDARCGGQECKRVLYDEAETVRVVRECIEPLPKCI